MIFQSPASEYAQALILMHNYLMIILIGVGIFVAVVLLRLLYLCIFYAPYYSSWSGKGPFWSFFRTGINLKYHWIGENFVEIVVDEPIVGKKLHTSVYSEVKFYWLLHYTMLLRSGKEFIDLFGLAEQIGNYPTKPGFNTGLPVHLDNMIADFSVFSTGLKKNNSLQSYKYNDKFFFPSSYSSFATIVYKNRLEDFNTFSVYFREQPFFLENLFFFELFFVNRLNSDLLWENVRHSTKLEIVWTLIPTMILFFVAVPSFSLLYGYDEPLDMPVVTLKVIGHQGYWSYEYSDYAGRNDLETISFDSYMIHQDDLEKGQLRLLETDTRVVLPVGATIRALVTSGDVLHSWAVPSLGCKMDAVPGRLNQVLLYITRPGSFFGQCSELCGVQHGFMPIVVDAVGLGDYFVFLKIFYS